MAYKNAGGTSQVSIVLDSTDSQYAAYFDENKTAIS